VQKRHRRRKGKKRYVPKERGEETLRVRNSLLMIEKEKNIDPEQVKIRNGKPWHKSVRCAERLR